MKIKTLRRLCRYMTLDPTEMIALDYDNNVVEQPDLKDSLTKRLNMIR